MTPYRRHLLKELGIAAALSAAVVVVMATLAKADEVYGIERFTQPTVGKVRHDPNCSAGNGPMTVCQNPETGRRAG